MRRALLAALLVAAGCSRPASEPNAPAPPAIDASPPAARVAREGGLAGLGASPVPHEEAPPPLDLGPIDASVAERRQAAVALLAGDDPARRLPEMATEPGEDLDPWLIDKLAAPAHAAATGDVVVSDVQSETVPRPEDKLGLARPALRRCYLRGLRDDPDAAGVARIHVDVDAGGAPTHVLVSLPGPRLRSVAECMEAALKRVSFAPPKDGKPGEIRLTITLSVNEPPPP